MYELQTVRAGLHRIALAHPEHFPEPLDSPANVYLLDADAPALINAGHPAQFEALCQALHALGTSPAHIERVLHTSWRIDVLGAAASLPGADHFVLSPDMVAPRDYEAFVAQQRDAFCTLARDIAQQRERYDEDDLAGVDAFARAYWPRMPRRLNVIPIRSGQTMALGDHRFEVIETPGATAGNLALYHAPDALLFCGDTTIRGMPAFIEQVQPYLVSLERLLGIEADHLLPNIGRPIRRSRLVIRQALSFLNNFLSNAPAAMHDSPTVLEFIEVDLGFEPESLVEMAWQVKRYRGPLDELARARMIDTDGRGLARRYGVDVEDPRSSLRR